jgi:hypothetical protein
MFAKFKKGMSEERRTVCEINRLEKAESKN